jgi:4-amino-4-deoxy-L-arabinose transferase-like glycosyltransferase
MTPVSSWPRRHAELLLLAAWLLSTAGLRPLMLPDEGRYAGVAYEMLHGNLLVPTLNGLPFFHKPPLLYWLDAAAMAVLGPTPLAARLGPALLGWCLGAVLFLHLRRWHGQAVARAGLLVLATSPLCFIGAQYVNHDVGVAACITAAVLAFLQGLDGPAAQRRRWLLAGWACCGLGVLAKGLIGVVLPLAVLLPWLLAQRRWADLRALANPLGPLLCVALALPWMLWMEHLHPGFFQYFIGEQHFHRYGGTTYNNREPWWFFWVALPLLMLPWSLWLWPALRRRASGIDSRTGLYLWWAAAVLVFFSVPASKLVGYAMPALAPVAALLALALALQPHRVVRGVGAVAALACVGIVVLLGWQAPGSNADLAQALRAAWQPGDQLVFAESAFYDLRMLARVADPAVILSDWGDPQARLADTWRKELLDATRFAPAAAAPAVLWTWGRLPELARRACQGGRVWVASTQQAAPRLGVLQPLTVATGHHGVLLQVPARNCQALTGPPSPGP